MRYLEQSTSKAAKSNLGVTLGLPLLGGVMLAHGSLYWQAYRASGSLCLGGVAEVGGQAALWVLIGVFASGSLLLTLSLARTLSRQWALYQVRSREKAQGKLLSGILTEYSQREAMALMVEDHQPLPYGQGRCVLLKALDIKAFLLGGLAADGGDTKAYLLYSPGPVGEEVPGEPRLVHRSSLGCLYRLNSPRSLLRNLEP